MNGFSGHGFTRNGHGREEPRLDHLAIARHLVAEHADYDRAIAGAHGDELALFAIANALVGIGDLIAEAMQLAADRND